LSSVEREEEPEIDLALIRGQEKAKRVLEIAASGNHNIIILYL